MVGEYGKGQDLGGTAVRGQWACGLPSGAGFSSHLSPEAALHTHPLSVLKPWPPGVHWGWGGSSTQQGEVC